VSTVTVNLWTQTVDNTKPVWTAFSVHTGLFVSVDGLFPGGPAEIVIMTTWFCG